MFEKSISVIILLSVVSIVSGNYMLGNFINDHVITAIEYCGDQQSCTTMLIDKLQKPVSIVFVEPSAVNTCIKLDRSLNVKIELVIQLVSFETGQPEFLDKTICQSTVTCFQIICNLFEKKAKTFITIKQNH